MNHPLGFRIETRHPLSGIWVFQIAEPVPDKAADIMQSVFSLASRRERRREITGIEIATVS
jgi:hypothetical protein